MKTLGATSNRYNWGWAVEFKGTVADDISTWTFSQTYNETSTFTYLSSVDGLRTFSSSDSASEDLGAFMSQPAAVISFMDSTLQGSRRKSIVTPCGGGGSKDELYLFIEER